MELYCKHKRNGTAFCTKLEPNLLKPIKIIRPDNLVFFEVFSVQIARTSAVVWLQPSMLLISLFVLSEGLGVMRL